jgi:hypothetical protein
MEHVDRWRKSSHSGNGGNDCVELADRDGLVLVRDTKQAGTGPVLTFGAKAWREFIGQVR